MLLSFQTCVAATLSLLLVAAPQTAAADLHTRLPTQGAADVNLLIVSTSHAGPQHPDRQLVEADQQPRYTASGASHPVVVASAAAGAANGADTISREQPSVVQIGKADTGSNPGAEAQAVPVGGLYTDHVAAASRTISGAQQGSTASDRLGAARASSDTAALDQILRTADQEDPEENSIADVLLDEQGPTDWVWRQRRISLDEAYVRLNATASEDPALQLPLSDHAQLAIGRHRACSAFYLKGRPPVQRVALVGNGPLTDQQRAEVDTLDLVIRFNKMNNRCLAKVPCDNMLIASPMKQLTVHSDWR